MLFGGIESINLEHISNDDCEFELDYSIVNVASQNTNNMPTLELVQPKFTVVDPKDGPYDYNKITISEAGQFKIDATDVEETTFITLQIALKVTTWVNIQEQRVEET